MRPQTDSSAASDLRSAEEFGKSTENLLNDRNDKDIHPNIWQIT